MIVQNSSRQRIETTSDDVAEAARITNSSSSSSSTNKRRASDALSANDEGDEDQVSASKRNKTQDKNPVQTQDKNPVQGSPSKYNTRRSALRETGNTAE